MTPESAEHIRQHNERQKAEKKAKFLADPFDMGWNAYDKYVCAVIDLILREEVWPLFKKRGYTMLAGNGDFDISDADGMSLETNILTLESPGGLLPHNPDHHEHALALSQDEEYMHVIRILCTDIPGMPANDIGSYSSSYPPEEGWEEDPGFIAKVGIETSLWRLCTSCQRNLDHPFLNGCMNASCPHGLSPCP